VPAIVLWISHGVTRLRSLSLLRRVEGTLLVAAVAGVSFLAFGWQSAGPSAAPALVYMPLPFLLWAVVRFGPLGSTTCVLILVVLSIWETVHGHGPFISSSPEENVFFLQLFLIFVSMPLFFLAALLEERRAAEQTRAQAAAIVEFSNDAIIGETLGGIITSWNRGAEKLFGYAVGEVTGRRHTILIPSDHGTLPTCNAERINEPEAIQSYETVGLAKGGMPIHVSVTQSSVLDAKGRKIGVSSIIRDITYRKRAESRLNAQYAVTRALAESNSVADAAPRILQGICECLDWELGELWRVDCQTNLMTLFKSWHLPSKELAEFAFESRRFTFSPGVGLPGRLWKRCEAGWITNLADDSNFLRGSLAASAGLRCAFGFPVVLGDETLGAMVFFSHDYREPDHDLLEMMASVSSQLGQFIERKEAEAALRDSQERSEEALRTALAEVQQLKLRLEADNVYLREEISQTHRYEEMIGESEGIKKVFEQVERVAPTDMTLLIVGETGTGKELVARLVHERSGRRERPLVKVNCSTLPAELIESELFGHEKGAFTGAVSKQVGRFELADGGTIFLDEVGELPLKLQSKLLRVLQEGEFERLGSGKTIKVDVRVIAATNRNLSEAAQRGRFRIDLYYRLNVYPIEIPPLRERTGDIGLLAKVFLHEAGRRLGKSFGDMSNEVVEALREYGWPGNVRELENVISRAAVLSTAPTLQLPVGWNKAPINDASKIVPQPLMSHSESPESVLTLEQLERTRILEVLRQTNWRIEGPKGAAVILGLHPNTLRSRLHKYDIKKPSRLRNFVVETTKLRSRNF
ncbi:MAG TPA: sigma 54-interacting transcriptional regulator, partial [Candidatus Binatia bacterium]|nr:sigma 54-interacting transcriptional regulator [Candidatus Binatia bacterium]